MYIAFRFCLQGDIHMRPALPCRLDAQDENHDHQVLGYAVYIGGQQRARVEGPLASQAELYGLDCTTDYHIQVWYVIDDACMHVVLV